MEFIQDYALFLARVLTLLVAFAVILGMLGGMAGKRRGRQREQLEVEPLNRRYEAMSRRIEQGIQTARPRLLQRLRERRRGKRRGQGGEGRLPRLFVLEFDGDIRATAVDALREEVSAIIATAKRDDEVLLRLERPGGMVPGYGLAASQLARAREAAGGDLGRGAPPQVGRAMLLALASLSCRRG